LLRGRHVARTFARSGGAVGCRVRAGACLRRARIDLAQGRARVKPRVLFVSRRVQLPLSPSLARKWDAVGHELDFRGVAGRNGHEEPFRLAPTLPALDGPAFFAALPVRIARELRSFRPHAVLAQGAHEAAAALSARRLARVETAVIADMHGDWRAP